MPKMLPRPPLHNATPATPGKVSFTVPGLPVAQPRQRHRVVESNGQTFSANYTPAKHPVNDYKATVRLAAQQAGGQLTREAVAVSLLFIFPRPARLVWKTKPMPRCPHTSKPDCENVAKAVLDALTGLLWQDDAQVAQLAVNKVYGACNEPVGTEIEVSRLLHEYSR